MPHALYVCLQDDNKIAVFAIESESGQLSPRAEVPLAGGPSVMALSPDRQKVYVGTRTEPAISTYGIDQGTGSLTLQGSAATKHAPTFLAPDRTGKYLLPADHAPTEAVPSAFALDPDGRFLFAAGTASGRLTAYRINSETGRLMPLSTQTLGQRPAAVLVTRYG
jgi:6-phosphogluconolactonase